jgi:hypothetical protein
MPSIRIDNVVPSLAGQFLSAHQKLNKPYRPKPNSTLNQKLDIHPSVLIPPSEVFGIKYLVAGNGGLQVAPGAGGKPLVKYRPPRPTNTCLYDLLPMAIRPVNEGLTGVERARYRLRNIQTIRGVEYEVYHAVRINTDNIDIRQRFYNSVTGAPLDFEYAVSDMSPIPPVLNTNGTVNTSESYYRVDAMCVFTFDEFLISEILNAATVLYGDPDYAWLSEFGLCSGVDMALPGNFNGTTQNYTEAVGTQISVFMSTNSPMRYEDKDLTLNFNFGSLNPMLDIL